VILVHGAANSGCGWTFLQDELADHGWSSHAIDLRGHGASAAADLGITRMADYADDDRVRTPPDDSLPWSPVGAWAD
jgi:pimeloyl-ACP methyl ester carboxylesterase